MTSHVFKRLSSISALVVIIALVTLVFVASGPAGAGADAQDADVCNLPQKPGPCRAYMPRYFYDTDSGSCAQFIYGGCQGNGNRFGSLTDCEAACGNVVL